MVCHGEKGWASDAALIGHFGWDKKHLLGEVLCFGSHDMLQGMRFGRIIMWGAVVVAVAAVVYGLIWLQETSPVNRSQAVGNGNVSVPPPTAADWAEGSPSASTTLIEYGDFQCPVCSVYAPISDQLVKDFQGKLLFVYRYFPLETIHENAALSAAAAEAAGKQGKFWEMHDLLFKNQNSWADQSSADAGKTFAGYASELGLNAQEFEADMDSAAVGAKIQADYANDLKMGLSYTPTFFLDGKLIQNPQGYDEFKQLIQQSLGAN